MILDGLRRHLGRWFTEHPKQRLRRAYALLPDGAFQLDGMHHTRADVEELLDGQHVVSLFREGPPQ